MAERNAAVRRAPVPAIQAEGTRIDYIVADEDFHFRHGSFKIWLLGRNAGLAIVSYFHRPSMGSRATVAWLGRSVKSPSIAESFSAVTRV